MDETASRKPSPRHQSARNRKARKTSGLKLVERDGHWHIQGTIRVKGRSVRIRQSTGYEASKKYEGLAEEELEAIREEVRGRELYGVKPSRAVSRAALDYLERPRKRPIGATSRDVILEINEKFQTRLLRDIPPAEWKAWVDDRQRNNKPETRERFLSSVVAFLNWAKAENWIDDIPRFERDKDARNPLRRQRRRIGEVTPEMVALMIDHASPHLKGQLAAEWSTGARVSSILWGCRICDLNLAEGREALTFHNTKNGDSVDAALHPWAVEILREYMEWRGGWHRREDPLFVTDKKVPYKTGSHNTTAFNNMKKRAVKALRRRAARARVEGDRDAANVAWAQAGVLRRFTQHWFRHMLATEMLTQGADLRTVMSQGGWRDPQSVLGYSHDVPKHRREVVENRVAPGEMSVTSLTRGKLERK